MTRFALGCVLAVCLVGIFTPSALAQGSTTDQLSSPRLVERAQRALFPLSTNPFLITADTLTAPSLVDNAAVRQLQADKTPFPILSTLPNGGSAFFISALKPCGLLLPHLHQRATEQFIIVSGTMSVGLSEENGGRQNITFDVAPGQGFLAPQGLVHFNANKGCSPLVFIQVFNHADPGALNIIGALAALRNVDNATITASNAGGVTASPQGAFALDPVCLQECGLPATGGDLSSLSAELQGLLGLSGGSPSPSGAPRTPTPSNGAPISPIRSPPLPNLAAVAPTSGSPSPNTPSGGSSPTLTTSAPGSPNTPASGNPSGSGGSPPSTGAPGTPSTPSNGAPSNPSSPGAPSTPTTSGNPTPNTPTGGNPTPNTPTGGNPTSNTPSGGGGTVDYGR